MHQNEKESYISFLKAKFATSLEQIKINWKKKQSDSVGQTQNKKIKLTKTLSHECDQISV